MIVRFAVFFLSLLAILGGAHLLVYFSLIRFFRITDSAVRHWIAAITFFLALSFVLSSTLAHYQDNPFSRLLYLAASSWLGILTNLFLASLLLWLALPLVSRFHPPLVAGIVFSLALLVSAAGIFNAFSPRIREIEVAIPGLPEAWKGKKVVQLSDIHLGHIYREDFSRKLVAQVNSLGPEAVFLTGDIFDGMDGTLAGLTRPFEKLSAPQGIFFVTGNHETYLGVDRATEAFRGTPIRFLSDQAIDLGGLQVIGYGYPPREEMYGEKKDFTATVRKMTDFKEEKPTILLHHAPTDIAAAKDLGVNLQLSGHTHRGQLFPFNFITSLVYKGYDYGLRTEGAYSIYTTPGVGTWGPPMRTNSRPEIVVITLR